MLLGAFVVEYVKKYGGIGIDDIYTRTVNCMYGDVTIGISDIPGLRDTLSAFENTSDDVKQEADELKENKISKTSFDSSNGYVVSELTADLVDQTLTIKKNHTSVIEDEEIVYPLHLTAVDGLVFTPDTTIPTEPVIKISVPELVNKVDKDGTKVLSDENFSTALLDKLNSITPGAGVSVQSDWNQTTTTAADYIKNKPIIVDDLTTGGHTSIASAESVKELKSQLNVATAQQHLRGAVWNALTSSSTNNYGINGTSITINAAGTGYKVGDAVFIPASTSQGEHSIDAIIVITGVSSGAVSSFTVSKVGDYETAGVSVVTAIGGSGTGLKFNVTWVTKPASTLANIQNPVANDIAFVLEDEVHNGETWQWAMMDYNGDGIFNWVPITTVDVKARDFITNPITAAELATDAVTVGKIPDGSINSTKIQNQSITSEKIDPTFLTSIVNVQSNWNQTTTTASDFIKNKPGNVTTSVNGFMIAVDKTKLDTVLTQWYGTAAEYAAIGTKNPNVEYNIYE